MDDRYFAIIPALFVAVFAVLGIMLLCGKASKTIAGYNAKATDENAKFFEKIVCRSVGVYLLILDFFFVFVFVGLMMKNGIIAGIAGGLGAVFALCGAIYMANDTRLKRALFLAKELEKNPDGLNEQDLKKWKNELGNFRKTKK